MPGKNMVQTAKAQEPRKRRPRVVGCRTSIMYLDGTTLPDQLSMRKESFCIALRATSQQVITQLESGETTGGKATRGHRSVFISC